VRRTWLIGALGVVLIAGIVGAFVVVSNNDDGSGRPDLGQPRKGGALRVAVVNLQTLDPARALEPSAVMVADQLFDTLVRYDGQSGGIEASVAGAWESSFDQRRFTFTIQDGLRFHDGTPLTAEDVKASIDRIAAPGSESQLRFQLETVDGYAAFHDERTAKDLSGVKVVAANKLSIELTQPFAQFPLVLANPGFGVVPSEKVGEIAFGEAPVGSGPLKFAGRNGDVISLIRVDEYLPQPTFLDGVDLHLMSDPNNAFDALKKGEVDLAPVPPDRVNEAAAEYGEPGFGPFAGVLFYGMNFEAPAFQDVRMRQAVIHAVDRERIVEVVYDGTVVLADGFVPTGVPEVADNACGARCAHDPGKARELVQAAFPGGNVPTVRIDFDEDSRQRAVASAIESDLKEVGIPTELRPHTLDDYRVFLVNDQPELFRLGWTADYLSADAFLFPLFVTDQENNLMNLSARDVDQKLRTARAERDPERRAELYRQIEQVVLDLAPVLPIAQFTNRWAAAADVGGFAMTPLGTFDVTDVFLARSTASG